MPKLELRNAGRMRAYKVADKRWAMCPSCKKTGEFEFLGEQHWPAEVARRLNLPTVMALWSCPCCHTTISERDLLTPRMGMGGASAPKAQSSK